MTDPGVLNRFTVAVDGLDLGAFTECKGLNAGYSLEPILEGGSLAPTGQLLKGLTYGDITLARPLNAGSGAVAAWFSTFADNPVPTTARIAALDSSGATICAWKLNGVVPKLWSGPQWSAKGADVAIETLTLAHTGFTPDGGAGAAATAGIGAGAAASFSGGIGLG
jgi:phage tail-like protein